LTGITYMRNLIFYIHFNAMEFLKELLLFLKTRKKFWLIPLVVILVLFSVLIILASVPALGPFIYSLF